jgi:hypothetical protein
VRNSKREMEGNTKQNECHQLIYDDEKEKKKRE